MSVIHIVYACDPGNHRGGVSKAVHELALAQHRAGVPVEVWSVAPKASATHEHGYLHRRFAGARFLGSIHSADILREMRLQRAPAVIHLHNTFHALNFQANRRARSLGLKVVHHPHGALDPVLLAGWSPKAVKKRIYTKLVEVPCLNRANAVIALTEHERGGLVELGVRSPIHVVPNGIELAAYDAPRVPRGDLGLLYVGRINPKKRIEHIIEALSILVKTGRRAHLHIAGNEAQFPGYTARLRALGAELGVADHVSWLGFRNEEQKRELFARADLFVHASESEGMAMAILEAMAYAVPVVASAGCYMSAAAEAGALIQYDEGPRRLADAIARFDGLDQSARRAQGEAGKAYVVARHDWATIASDLNRIYATC